MKNLPLNRVATLNYANEHDHDGNNEKDVDVSSQGVRTHHAEQPQNEQDYENRPEHVSLP
jgi:hypothetical protein